MDSGFQYKRNFIRRTLCSSQNRKARESRSIWVTQLITNRKTVLHNLSTCSHCWQSTWTLNPVPLSLLFQKSDLETSAASSWENKQVLPWLLVLTTNLCDWLPQRMTDTLFQGKPRFLWDTQLGDWMGEGENRKWEPKIRGSDGAVLSNSVCPLYFLGLCTCCHPAWYRCFHSIWLTPICSLGLSLDITSSESFLWVPKNSPLLS